MKNASLFISIAALVVAVALGVISLTVNKGTKAEAGNDAEAAVAQTGAIVYFQLDKVMQEYDMANDLSSVVETKVQNIQNALTSRQNKLEKEYADFNDKMNKGLMTRSVAEVKAQELEKKRAEFEQYANQKQQEMMEEQQVMMNQIGDAIQSFIDNFNEEKQYSMIIASQGGAPVIAADSTLDITDVIVAGLNEAYVQSKSEKKSE